MQSKKETILSTRMKTLRDMVHKLPFILFMATAFLAVAWPLIRPEDATWAYMTGIFVSMALYVAWVILAITDKFNENNGDGNDNTSDFYRDGAVKPSDSDRVPAGNDGPVLPARELPRATGGVEGTCAKGHAASRNAEGKGDITAIQTIFNSSVRLHRLLALLVCGLYVIAGFFLFNGILNIPTGRETTALIVYGCLIFSTVFSITITPYDAVLNAHENMFFYSLVGIIDVFLKLAIAILISYSDYDRLLFYGVLMAGESWLLRFITKYYCDRTYPVCKALSSKEHDNGILKKMASFAGWQQTLRNSIVPLKVRSSCLKDLRYSRSSFSGVMISLWYFPFS